MGLCVGELTSGPVNLVWSEPWAVVVYVRCMEVTLWDEIGLEMQLCIVLGGGCFMCSYSNHNNKYCLVCSVTHGFAVTHGLISLGLLLLTQTSQRE